MSTAEDYRILDRDIALLHYEIAGSNMYEQTPFCPTRTTIHEYQNRADALLKRAQALEVYDKVSEIFRNRFIDVLNEMIDNLHHTEQHPADLLGSHIYYIENLARLDCRSTEERIALAEERLDKLKDVLASITDLLAAHPESTAEVKSSLQYMVGQLQYSKEDVDMNYPQLDAAVRQEFFRHYEETGKQLKEYADHLEEDSSPAEESLRISPERYRDVLYKQHGVLLDELLADYEQDIEETRNRVFALAAQLPIPEEEKPHTMQEVSAILNKYAGPADTAEEMFERIRGYLARGRKVAHENVRLPEDERCSCVQICRILKDSYPWGGCEMGDAKARPVTGQMFLNNYNVSAVTDGWMKINAIHECYPGHHVQFVRSVTDRTPETLKMDSRNIPLLEGTAIRTETVFAYIYNDDPFYPVFAAYRRHHASVRIKVDLMLYIERKSPEECAQVYVEELGFDPQTAMGQVRAQLNMPGYFTCYHYGLKKILQWEKESGLPVKDYTERLFSAGYLNIFDFHKYLQLNEEERYSYSHDYASMLRDFEGLPDLCSR